MEETASHDVEEEVCSRTGQPAFLVDQCSCTVRGFSEFSDAGGADVLRIDSDPVSGPKAPQLHDQRGCAPICAYSAQKALSQFGHDAPAAFGVAAGMA